LAEFETGVRSFQQHDYQGAAVRFRSLMDAFPAERALLDRVRVYLEICERELRKKPLAAKTIEEQVTFATAALNDGNDSSAERLARQVLDQSPDHDLALYILAAVRARKGDRSAALDFLRQAVRVSPDVSAQARHDADFEPLRQSAEFQALLEVQGRNGHSDARKPRRSRTDR
jgi:cytochrome c-type biogenesis protein CcmH/NrfG